MAGSQFLGGGLKGTDRTVSIAVGSVPGVSATRPLQRLGYIRAFVVSGLLHRLIDQFKAAVFCPA
jgi:hypothetical protein